MIISSTIFKDMKNLIQNLIIFEKLNIYVLKIQFSSMSLNPSYIKVLSVVEYRKCGSSEYRNIGRSMVKKHKINS